MPRTLLVPSRKSQNGRRATLLFGCCGCAAAGLLTPPGKSSTIRNMSNTAQVLSEQELEAAARMFKALSNPHRLRIFKKLSCCWAGQVVTGPAENFSNCQREFAERLGLAPSTVSHHFKELRQAGLIHMKRDGKEILFWVDEKAVNALRALLDA